MQSIGNSDCMKALINGIVLRVRTTNQLKLTRQDLLARRQQHRTNITLEAKNTIRAKLLGGKATRKVKKCI